MHTYDITAQRELQNVKKKEKENLVSGKKLMSGPRNLISHVSCSSALSQSRRKYHNVKGLKAAAQLDNGGRPSLGRDESRAEAGEARNEGAPLLLSPPQSRRCHI